MFSRFILALILGGGFCVGGASKAFAANFDIQSSKSGLWSDPETWRPRRVPRAGDRVLVTGETKVLFDVESEEVIRSIRIAGVLSFARHRKTLLNVGMIRVQPMRSGDEESSTGVEDVHDHEKPHSSHAGGMSALEVGLPDAPIPRKNSARIRLHYLKGMNADDAPAITCRPGGRMEFHGAPMNRTWVDLGATVKPGAAQLMLSEDVTGWRVGDSVIVTGSKHQSSFGGGFRNDRESVSTEERRIQAIDGRRLLLDKPLEHEHFGEGAQRSEVANLTRSVVVESATPDGVRGHTMYHKYSRGSISYARFAHLGKEGVLGRYSIHYHRVRSTLRGSSVIGAAIVDSHNRWITIHSTEYLVVRDCVGYQSLGHGYFLEDGTEVLNVLDRNLGVQSFRTKRLPNQVLPFDPNDGAAFWWANGRNTFVRNTACENDRYGFRYDSQKRSNFDSNLPVLMPDGSSKVVDIRTLPIYRFENNETHTEGLYGVAIAGTDGVGPDTQHPHVIKGLNIWQVHYGLRVQVPTMWIEDVDIDHAAYGIYRPWFKNHVYRNIRIAYTNTEPFNRGLDDRSEQHGKITVDGLTFEGFRNSGMPLIQISANNLSGDAESHFRNIKLVERKDGKRRALVNLGGGPRREQKTERGVPVYVHDWYGKGRHARVVSTRAKGTDSTDAQYGQVALLTGDESRAKEVSNVVFPQLLGRVDDLPPATIVTYPQAGVPVEINDGKLTLRGTTTDNERTKRVIVNGVEAENLSLDFHEWRVTLKNVVPGELEIYAHGVDAAGNVEMTGHKMTVEVKPSVRRF